MDELQLISEAKRGNERALAELLHGHYPFVFKYLLHLTFHRQLAEDLTQDTMIRAIEKIELYDNRRSKFTSWLLTIATRLYRDQQRKKRRETLVSNSMMKDAKTDTRTIQWSVERLYGEQVSLIDALGRLPEGIRMAVILKHYHGYEYKEIATILGIPAGTAKSRVHNGLQTLKEEWNKNEGETNANR